MFQAALHRPQPHYPDVPLLGSRFRAFSIVGKGGGTREQQKNMKPPAQVFVQVAYDFEYVAEDGKRVYMKENEILLLINKTNHDWWQVIRRGDRRPFYAPAKYVVELRPEEIELAAATGEVASSQRAMHSSTSSHHRHHLHQYQNALASQGHPRQVQQQHLALLHQQHPQARFRNHHHHHHHRLSQQQPLEATLSATTFTTFQVGAGRSNGAAVRAEDGDLDGDVEGALAAAAAAAGEDPRHGSGSLPLRSKAVGAAAAAAAASPGRPLGTTSRSVAGSQSNLLLSSSLSPSSTSMAAAAAATPPKKSRFQERYRSNSLDSILAAASETGGIANEARGAGTGTSLASVNARVSADASGAAVLPSRTGSRSNGNLRTVHHHHHHHHQEGQQPPLVLNFGNVRHSLAAPGFPAESAPERVSATVFHLHPPQHHIIPTTRQKPATMAGGGLLYGPATSPGSNNSNYSCSLPQHHPMFLSTGLGLGLGGRLIQKRPTFEGLDKRKSWSVEATSLASPTSPFGSISRSAGQSRGPTTTTSTGAAAANAANFGVASTPPVGGDCEGYEGFEDAKENNVDLPGKISGSGREAFQRLSRAGSVDEGQHHHVHRRRESYEAESAAADDDQGQHYLPADEAAADGAPPGSKRPEKAVGAEPEASAAAADKRALQPLVLTSPSADFEGLRRSSGGGGGERDTLSPYQNTQSLGGGLGPKHHQQQQRPDKVAKEPHPRIALADVKEGPPAVVGSLDQRKKKPVPLPRYKVPAQVSSSADGLSGSESGTSGAPAGTPVAPDNVRRPPLQGPTWGGGVKRSVASKVASVDRSPPSPSKVSIKAGKGSEAQRPNVPATPSKAGASSSSSQQQPKSAPASGGGGGASRFFWKRSKTDLGAGNLVSYKAGKKGRSGPSAGVAALTTSTATTPTSPPPPLVPTFNRPIPQSSTAAFVDVIVPHVRLKSGSGKAAQFQRPEIPEAKGHRREDVPHRHHQQEHHPQNLQIDQNHPAAGNQEWPDYGSKASGADKKSSASNSSKPELKEKPTFSTFKQQQQQKKDRPDTSVAPRSDNRSPQAGPETSTATLARQSIRPKAIDAAGFPAAAKAATVDPSDTVEDDDGASGTTTCRTRSRAATTATATTTDYDDQASMAVDKSCSTSFDSMDDSGDILLASTARAAKAAGAAAAAKEASPTPPATVATITGCASGTFRSETGAGNSGGVQSPASTISRTPPSPTSVGLSPSRQVMADWDEYEDVLTGRKFYYNSSTKEKSWKPPRKAKGPEEKGPETDNSRASSPEVFPDEVRGRHVKGSPADAVEDDPTDVEADEGVPADPGADNGRSGSPSWRGPEASSGASGRQAATGSSSSRVPEGYERRVSSHDGGASEPYFVNVFTGVRWFSAADEATGKVYFYEENGNESCWTLPNVSRTFQDRNKANSGGGGSATDLDDSATGSKVSSGHGSPARTRASAAAVPAGSSGCSSPLPSPPPTPKSAKEDDVEKAARDRSGGGEAAVNHDNGDDDVFLHVPEDQGQGRGRVHQRDLAGVEFRVGNVRIVVVRQGPLHKTKLVENGKKQRKNWTSSHAVLTDTFLLLFKDSKSFAALTSGRDLGGPSSSSRPPPPQLSTSSSAAATASALQAASTKPDVCVDLKGASVDWCVAGDKSKRSNVFEATTLLGLSVLLQSDNAQLAAEWFQDIREVVDRVNFRASHPIPTPGLASMSKVGGRRSTSHPSEDEDASSSSSVAVVMRKQSEGSGPLNPTSAAKARVVVGRTKSLKMMKFLGGSTEDLLDHQQQQQQHQQRINIKEKLLKFFLRRPAMEDLFKRGIMKNEPVFGSTLKELQAAEQLQQQQQQPPAASTHDDLLKDWVPQFVRRCVGRIESGDHLKTDGVYRQSGNLSTIQKIRLQVDQGNLAVLESVDDVHVLTGALKLFFRELKEPLIPWEIVDRLLLAANHQSKKQRLKQLKSLVNQGMPPAHRTTLAFLLRHLVRVTEHKDRNRMQFSNLAIVFGPTLMWPPTHLVSHNLALDMMQQNIIVEALLTNVAHIFGPT